jgi:hypothetical protein
MSMPKLDADVVQAILDCEDADAVLQKFLATPDDVREQFVKFLRKVRGVSVDFAPSTSLTDVVEAIIDAEDADTALRRLLELPDDTREQAVRFFRKARNARVTAGPAPAQPAAPPAASPPVQGLHELIGIGWAFGASAADWTINSVEEWLEQTYILPPFPRNSSRLVKHINRSSHSADPADRFVDAGKTLVRLLRIPFNDSILRQGGELQVHNQYDDGGEAFLSDEYLEATMTYRGHNLRFVILDGDFIKAPRTKLCARFESGRIVKGRASPETWQAIIDAVQLEAQQPPPVRPAPPPPPDDGPWDERGRRIGGPRTPPRFLPPREDLGSGWAF